MRVNMFPHTITIYTLDSNGDTYSHEVVSGVYWYGTNSLSKINKGEEKGNAINIVIPLSNKPQTLKKGSILVKGEHDPIQSIKDLENIESVTVQSIAIYDSHRPIDNIVVTCV